MNHTTGGIKLSVIGIALLTACAPSTIKQTQPVQNNNQAKEERKYAIETKPIKQESLGIVGGSGPEQNSKSVEKGPSAERISIGESNAAVKQFYEGYDKATDRLGYLLSSINSKYDAVLYATTTELSAFDDPRSIAALQQLLHHQMREELVRTVADGAQQSLDTITFNRDKAKLTAPTASISEKRAIIKKYSEQGNRVARSNILRYLRDNAVKDPATYAPMIIEFFPYDDLAKASANKYPEYADQGLDRCLMSTSGNTVKECMRLISELNKNKYLDRIYSITYEGKGAIDYANESEVMQVRIGATSMFVTFMYQALPYLEKILYGKYDKDREEAASIISHVHTEEAKNILLRFRDYYVKQLHYDKNILNSLDYAIQHMSGAGK